ncbi:MAG: hypothetical protein NC181_02365 [Clostridium sp.]|nr:hypothetical protein [Clostridium sp.]MCM1443728.1 hypothetical protein [Candidatus Amulumruptor caecigallinarius]
MIGVGSFLYFAPPRLSGNVLNNQKRLMLIISIDNIDNTITLVNISKMTGKPRCLTYSYNCLITKYNPPLPLLSFAKLNCTYVLENFQGLSNYLYKNGTKIDNSELKNIIQRRNNFISLNPVEQISISKAEFMTIN